MASILGKWVFHGTDTEFTNEFLSNGYMVLSAEGMKISKSGPDDDGPMLQEMKYIVDYSKDPHWIDQLSRNPLNNEVIVSLGIFKFINDNECMLNVIYMGQRPLDFENGYVHMIRES